MDSYYSIEKSGESNIKIKGSKFLGYAMAVRSEEEVKEKIVQIKKEHHKATHHCYAYRIGLEDPRELAKDDGEPSGTAGQPILGQIISRDLYNVLVVSVRYYGGTKLGTGGLKKAYKESASTALDACKIKQYTVYTWIEAEVDYRKNDNFLKAVFKNEGEVLDQKIDQKSTWILRIPKRNLNGFNKLTKNYAKLAISNYDEKN